MIPDTRSHRPRDPTFTQVLFLLLLISSLLGYAKIPYLNVSIFNLSHPLCALGLILLYRPLVQEAISRHRMILLALGLLYGWTGVSAFFSEMPALAIRYSLKYSLHLLAFLALLTATPRKEETQSLYRLVYRFMVVLAVFGVLEYVTPHLWVFTLLRSPDSLSVYPRVSSLMQGPNQYSTLLSVGVLAGLSSYHNNWITRLELGCGTLLLLVASLFARSENAWLVLLVGVVLGSLYSLVTVRTAGSLLGLFLLAAVFSTFFLDSPPTTRTTSVSPQSWQTPINSFLQSSKEKGRSRWVMWNTALGEVAKRPVTGVGLQAFGKVIAGPRFGNEHYHAHDLFLNVAAEMGLPGLLLLLIFLYTLFKHVNLSSHALAIPLIMLFASQILDYYLHDLTFTTFSLYFLAQALNSANAHT